jgi:hypothetical protein
MKKYIFGTIAILCWFGFAGCDSKKSNEVEAKKVVVHDTVYKETCYVVQQQIRYYDAEWLRSQFVIAPKIYWKNYEEGYVVGYPEFMNVAYKKERSMRVEFRDITMDVKSYDDQYDMSVGEKFEELNKSAVTKSLADSSFLLAGKCGNGKLYFEKDIKLKDRTWMYLRVEFSRDMTRAVDPLLHYVKDYRP